MSEPLAEGIAALHHLDLAAMQSELTDLLAIKRWAVASLRLGYGEGDRVEIISPEPSLEAQDRASGWYPYREAFGVGQSGVVREIYFNPVANQWVARVALDRCWSVSGDGLGKPFKRHWHGTKETCPTGFLWHREEDKSFAFNVRWVGPRL
jgi:hypothetical protein